MYGLHIFAPVNKILYDFLILSLPHWLLALTVSDPHKRK